MSSPESLAGEHTNSDIARRGQLWGPAAVTETTGRRLPSEASPSGEGGKGAGDKNKERVQSGSGWVCCQGAPPWTVVPGVRAATLQGARAGSLQLLGAGARSPPSRWEHPCESLDHTTRARRAGCSVWRWGRAGAGQYLDMY